MELTFYTDYALRTLMYVGAHPGKLSLISEMARDYRISRNHLVKVVYRLARGGFVKTFRGRGGGVTLARDPSEIRLGDVLRYTEGTIRLVECFRPQNLCVISPACVLPPILSEAFGNFLSTLDRYTLADLLSKHAAMADLLAAGSSAHPHNGDLMPPGSRRGGRRLATT